MVTKKITKVADLIAVLRTAKNGGKFTTINGEHSTKFNQFPNEKFCQDNGIALATGKGSKAINEPYRYNGNDYQYRFSVQFHFEQDYDKTLAKLGLSRSYNGSVNEIEHFGSIAMGYPSTHNICLVYMQGNYNGVGYFLNGTQVTDADELAYIAGYKSVTKQDNLQYRTLGVRNVRSITFGGTNYLVDIQDITDKDYNAVKQLFGEDTKKVAKVA